ncbi:hypothetical protein [Tsukamurella ocularis]|uniref:hypothetical protein n=1 Tax=Tsukamurella ocularis TaxID=1970234 RepID=UPI0021680548|nr:hypothetical protein [Tsukamurella ocularis]MCS3779345.1 hypothetical protein [Tsukamurella ocularis]MCS3789929.1 hypothetical protein [Tsukamurella ocularis]MCS3852426.1 hypothetical protein [Tsukamurella ocularis]
MAHPYSPVRFVSGNDRLRQILSEPELRARVDTIIAEQLLIDDRHRNALRTLRHSIAALTDTTGAIEVTDVLEALQRRLADAGVHQVGMTLNYGGYKITVPLEQILAAPDS